MDDKAIIFDVGSRAQLLQLKGHNGDVNAVRFSGDGARLVTGSDDKTLAMWRVGDGKVVAHMKGHGGIVFDAVFAPGGKVLARLCVSASLFPGREIFPALEKHAIDATEVFHAGHR